IFPDLAQSPELLPVLRQRLRIGLIRNDFGLTYRDPEQHDILSISPLFPRTRFGIHKRLLCLVSGGQLHDDVGTETFHTASAISAAGFVIDKTNPTTDFSH